MLQRRRVSLLTIVVGLAITATGYADMLALSELDAACRQSLNVRVQNTLQPGDCHYLFSVEVVPSSLLNFQSKIGNRK